MTRSAAQDGMFGFSITAVTLAVVFSLFYWVNQNSAAHDACIRKGGTNVTVSGECLRVERVP